MTDSDTPGPRAVAADHNQVPRLMDFRERHPEVDITLAGLWRAVIPQENGETVICRYQLRDVLDKLDELLGRRA